VTIPALLVGGLLGELMGRQLLAAAGSTTDGPTAAGSSIEVQIQVALPGLAGVPGLAADVPPSASAEPSGTVKSPGVQVQPSSGPGRGAPPLPSPSPPPPLPTPTMSPPPAWGQQINTSIQVIAYYPAGGSVMVGLAQGWFQHSTDRTKFRYSWSYCRQSSYMTPYMTVGVNGRWTGTTWQGTTITTIYPPYSGSACTAAVSNVHSHSPIQNVYFLLYGSTFNGSQHLVAQQDRVFY
jgi:hypothetical protein